MSVRLPMGAEGVPFGVPYLEEDLGSERRLLPPHPDLRENRSLNSLRHFHESPHSRFSQPDLYKSLPSNVRGFITPPHLYQERSSLTGSHGSMGGGGRRLPCVGPRGVIIGQSRRYLKRCPQSDLSHRFQRLQEQHSTENTPFRDLPIDPVYLALKQATGKYGGGSAGGSRRGSSAHPLDSSHSPSPSTLSRVSLQDSGYVEMPKSNPLLGSTPQLDHAGRTPAKRRAPKLTQQMKSLSLDCAEVPPRVPGTGAVSRSPISREQNKLSARETASTGKIKNGSSDLSDWERSCSPQVNSSRRASAQTLTSQPGHIVIHEYTPSTGQPLFLGERLIVVNNGDPDWLHGFRLSDRTEQLVSFPATCIGKVLPGEQPMKIVQNVCIPEIKLRLYRDQVVFAQPDSIREGKVTVRTERDVFTPCRLEFLSIL